MSEKRSVCREIEPAMVATAIGEADPEEVTRVESHVDTCGWCRLALKEYRAVDALVTAARNEAPSRRTVANAREALQARLTDLRQRTLSYGVFPSPLGPILIASSANGVSLVEYVANGRFEASRLNRMTGVDATECRQEVEPLHRQLLDYLAHRRAALDWPLDLRFARSDFQREVLQVTAALPYGAVASYTTIARSAGKPRGMRAVAEMLRWNPLPIAIPCHRVIATSGSLSGYSGGRVRLKRQLLASEGVRLVKGRDDFRIDPETMYACAPGDHAYCLPTCRSLRRIKPGRVTRFASRKSAEAAGLKPCTTCRPDLHALSGRG